MGMGGQHVGSQPTLGYIVGHVTNFDLEISRDYSIPKTVLDLST